MSTTHDRWIGKLLTTGGAMGAECMVCRFYRKIEGSLGYDWGVCTNAVSPHDGTVVFEHAGCPFFDWAPYNIKLDDA